jgi:serine/threonine-protein kinase
VLAETFEVTAILGVGGMGVVYEAFDRLLLRRVAIKAPIFPIYAPALRVEAQGLAAIRSPGFVKVHGLIRHEDVELLVMERLYGETRRIDEQRHRRPPPG